MMNKMAKLTTITMLTAAMGFTTVPATQAQAATPKLSQTSMTIYARKTKTLTLKNNTKGVKWSSTKASVASVKKGKVKAKKAGKATIKATVGKKTYKCKVTVKNPYLSATSVSMKKDETATLVLTGTKAQSYRSSDKTVVSATSKGKVIARKAGTATISVTDTEGRTYKCTVTVTENEEDNNNSGTENTGSTNGTETGAPTTINPEPENPAVTEQPETPAEQEVPATPAHQHRWANHWAYGADGKVYNDTRFCMDTTCTENKGFGTDDGWRGATLPGYEENTNSNTTGGDSGTSENSSGSTENKENGGESTENKENGSTEPTVTEQPEVHKHAWTVPVLEEQVDRTGCHELMLVASKCETCGEVSDHRHAWDNEITKENGSHGAQIMVGVECSICNESMTLDDIDKFIAAQRQDNERVLSYWVEKNLAGLTDLQKARKICSWVNSWKYGNVKENFTAIIFLKKAMCTGSNNQFRQICKAAGIEAEGIWVGNFVEDVYNYFANHEVSKVKIDGEWLYIDATAGGGVFGDKLVTEGGFNLWIDYINGHVTDEQYDDRMPEYER